MIGTRWTPEERARAEAIARETLAPISKASEASLAGLRACLKQAEAIAAQVRKAVAALPALEREILLADVENERPEEVARSANLATGPPPNEKTAPLARRGSSTKKIRRQQANIKIAHQTQSSLQSVYDGQQLLGFVRGAVAFDAAGHEIACLRNKAQAVMHVLDAASRKEAAR